MKSIAVASLVASLAITASANAINKPTVQGCAGTHGNGECWDIQADDGVCIKVPEIAASRIHSIRYGEPIYCDVFDDDECQEDSSPAAGSSVGGSTSYNKAVGSVQCWSSTVNLRRNDIARRAKSQRAKKNAEERQKKVSESLRRRSSGKPFWFPPEIQNEIEGWRDKIVSEDKQSQAAKDRMAQIAQEAAATAAFTNWSNKRDLGIASPVSDEAGMRTRRRSWSFGAANAVRGEGSRLALMAQLAKAAQAATAAFRGAEVSIPSFTAKETKRSIRRRSSDKKAFTFPAEIQKMIEAERDAMIRAEREAAQIARQKDIIKEAAQEAASNARFLGLADNHKRDLSATETGMRRRSSDKKAFTFPAEIQNMIEKERDAMIRAEREAAQIARQKEIIKEAAKDAASEARWLGLGDNHKRDLTEAPLRRRSSGKSFWFPPEIQKMIEEERSKLLQADRAKALAAEAAKEAASTARFLGLADNHKRDLSGMEDAEHKLAVAEMLAAIQASG